MGRAPCCEKVGLKKGRWTAEEDEILTKYIQANGEGSWRSLPKTAGLLRCGKSCRLRWINYLRADLKRGNISAEEEDTIIKLHASFGNRWSLIASNLPGRTDNEIKNYWNSHLSRKIYSFRGPASRETTPTGIMDPPKVTILPKRKGGRTSRWAMKKNKSYAQKDAERPNQSITYHQNTEAVPLPPTPALESDSLSSAAVDFMVVDPDTEDKAERAEFHQGPSFGQETQEAKGGTLLSCGGDRDRGLQVQYCPAEEATTIENSMLCLDVEKETDDILGPIQEAINGGGVLSFNDIMDTCMLEASGVLTLGEERGSSDAVGLGKKNERRETCPDKMVTSEDPESSVNHSSNGESGEWLSCSSMTSGFDDNWDWESVIELNHNNESESIWEHKENLLTWLWEDDDWESDCQKLEEIDPEKQNAMVAWFLS